jgi:hypothetical protein
MKYATSMETSVMTRMNLRAPSQWDVLEHLNNYILLKKSIHYQGASLSICIPRECAPFFNYAFTMAG